MAFFVCGSGWAAAEGAAMKISGWSFGKPEMRLAILPAIAVAGCAIWLMLPQASDAESRGAAPAEPAGLRTQAEARADETAAAGATPSTDTVGLAPTAMATPVVPPPEAIAPAGSPLDGLKIVSQSWRRGGLGSKALMTFTLRNANSYAVKDIEIACSFTRRDGRHLTDRRRIISDTVNMKSRKRYAGMMVGFVNVNANKARCLPVTASRI
jgi:hypothetical protein